MSFKQPFSPRLRASFICLLLTALLAVAMPTQPADAVTNVVDQNNWLVGDLEFELSPQGNPVIGYTNITPGRFGFFDTFVKVSTCFDPQCALSTTRILDEANYDDTKSSMTLNPSGNPVMSYTDADGALKIAICTDPGCNSVTYNVLDPGGEDPSMGINAAGNPVIAYMKSFKPWFLACGDPACATFTTNALGTDSVFSLSLQTDSAQRVLIGSTGSSSSGAVALTTCANLDCTSNSTVSMSSAFTTGDIKLALDAQDRPTAAFRDFNSRSFKVVACADQACSSTTSEIIDIGDRELLLGDPSIAIDVSGNPVIALHDYKNEHFVLASCIDRACTSATLTTMDSGELSGIDSAIQLNDDGVPVIAYDSTDGQVKLTTSCGYNFGDVASVQYYSAAVDWAACAAVTTGTTATTFSPTAPVSRGQLATFLWRYAGKPAGAAHSFTDVVPGVFYDEPVAWMANSGITTGTSDTTFSPSATVTRGQLATFLWRYAGEPTGYSHSFTDVPSGIYYEQGVAWMASTGITTGTSPTTFSPSSPLSRAQAVTFLHRYAQLVTT